MKMIYKVNEIFESFQGEGHHQGTLCTFIRLQGCSVGCDFCDTKHTWTVNPKFHDSRVAVLNKVEPSTSNALMTAEELLQHSHSDFVVITGGEPYEQDIQNLLEVLTLAGKAVSVETSGNSPIPGKPPGVWITVSPKVTKRTDINVLMASVAIADELKIVPSEEVKALIPELLRARNASCKVSFQPESCRADSKTLCLSLAKQYKAKLSFQIHKYVEER